MRLPLRLLCALTVVLLLPQMLLYMALAPEQKLTYKEGGPAAEARFEAGVAGMEARAFRGCGIFTSEPFEVSDDQVRLPSRFAPLSFCSPARACLPPAGLGPDADQVEPGRRVCVPPPLQLPAHSPARPTPASDPRFRPSLPAPRALAVYVMQPPQVPPETAAQAKFSADVLLYDEESDRHVRITWGQALRACCIGATATDIAPATVMSHPSTKMNALPVGVNAARKASFANWLLEALKIQAYNEGKSVIDAAMAPRTTDAEVDAANTAMFAAITAGNILAAPGGGYTAVTYANLDPDCRIVLARPFIEHLMHNVILTVSGRDTGATLFGPADMQLSANTQVKTIEGHYTGCVAAVASPPSPLLPRRHVAAHLPASRLVQALQGRDHQATERHDHARRGVRRLRCRLQHALLCRRRHRRHVGGDGGDQHDEPPLVCQRHGCQVRVHARLPVHGAAVLVGLPRHCHERDHTPLAMGSYLRDRRHALVLPRRRGGLHRVPQQAQPALDSLWRGHEGRREPGRPRLACAHPGCRLTPFFARALRISFPKVQPTTPPASLALTASTTRLRGTS